MTLNNELVDQLLKDYQTPEDILGDNGLLKQFTQAVLERALHAKLAAHLGYEQHAPAGKNSGNARNGHSQKTLKGEFGALPLVVPRDRNATFEPKIVPTGQTRFEGFDDKLLCLYARGLSTRSGRGRSVAGASAGGKFWLQILTELKNRGVRDHFHRLRGRTQGLSRSHRRSLSAHGGATV